MLRILSRPGKHIWNTWLLRLCERKYAQALANGQCYGHSISTLDESRCARLGRRHAELAAWRAWRHVPAYRDFLHRQGIVSPDCAFEQLPVMTKDNYIRIYPTQDRCLGGNYLRAGVAIDESSGSTGIPYNWVRGLDERRRCRQEMARMIEWALGDRPRIAINAFSMGAWATGVNMGEALELHGVTKSTGPDLENILHTLEFFGPDPGYFICGYPPFLKLVVDTMLTRGFPIERYELHAMVGGEGMSEGLRRYLLRYFKSCYSGYGASDLEMGIAVESEESIALRGKLHDDARLREELLDGDHRVPMIFQYNPLNQHLETNERGELIVTMNYSRILSPRIRYNIGDEARLFTRQELMRRLKDLGIELSISADRALRLPYLMLYGRSDHTISVMGANIYPQDIERAIFEQPGIAEGIASFTFRLEEREDGAAAPHLSLEWNTVQPPVVDLASTADGIKQRLMAINSDFRNAVNEYPSALDLKLDVHGYRQGPFASNGTRIKNRYLAGS